MFIASDYLEEGIVESEIDGHCARVVGDEDLSALHLKLQKRG